MTMMSIKVTQVLYLKSSLESCFDATLLIKECFRVFETLAMLPILKQFLVNKRFSKKRWKNLDNCFFFIFCHENLKKIN